MSEPNRGMSARAWLKHRWGTLVIVLCGGTVYALISASRIEVIGAGIVSCAGTAALLAAHPSQAASLIAPELFEYWIAAAAWCLIPLIAMRPIVRRLKRTHGASIQAEQHPGARYILAAFVAAALFAPVLAPLPPLAQGDLDHTRFLPPLSRGFSRTDVPEFREPPNLSRTEDAVRRANRFLLHRSVAFSADVTLAVSPDRAGSPSDTLDAARSGGTASAVVFLFGTDAVGRDIFSRVVYGSRYSIGIGFVVVFFSVLIGAVVGMAAGYSGGAFDSILMRTVDVLMSIPSLFLVLTLMAVLGQSVAAMIIVLTATEWMSIARIVRGEVIHIREREFISASRLLGTSWFGTLRLHVLPNVRSVIISAAVLQLGNIFLAEASLSFLGLGIQAPNPSWGNMIADSMAHMNAPLSAGIFPGIALSVLIVAVHIIGGSDE